MERAHKIANEAEPEDPMMDPMLDPMLIRRMDGKTEEAPIPHRDPPTRLEEKQRATMRLMQQAMVGNVPQERMQLLAVQILEAGLAEANEKGAETEF